VYFSFLCPPRQNPAKNQEAREANFAKCWGFGGKYFVKFASRSAFAFLHTISFWKSCVVCRAFSHTSASAEAPGFVWWCLLDEIRTHFEQNPEDFAD